MRRLSPLAALVIPLFAAATIAGAHWLGNDPTATLQGVALMIDGRAAGLGNGAPAGVPFALDGSVDVFSRCVNRGNNRPQADNKQETLAVAEQGNFPVKNGRTNMQFVIAPLSSLICPGNQVVSIECVDWDLNLTSTLYPELDTHLMGQDGLSC
jgi:hypothetical protein